MTDETYVKYLETVVLSLLRERGHEKELTVADTEASPSMRGSTCDPYMIRQAIVEKRAQRRKAAREQKPTPIRYKYVGSNPELSCKLAHGREEQGRLRIRVEDAGHTLSRGWYYVKRTDWVPVEESTPVTYTATFHGRKRGATGPAGPVKVNLYCSYEHVMTDIYTKYENVKQLKVVDPEGKPVVAP